MPVVDGAEPTIFQTRKHRPDVRSPVPGIYFAGDSWAGGGLGGDMASLSAELCLKKFLEDEE